MSNTVIDESALLASDIRCENRVPVAANAGEMRTGAPFALVIDDQEPICRVVAMALAQLGVESASYLTAKPAIASLDQRMPEVIFLDVALENSDAIDVIKGLHEKRFRGVIQLMSGRQTAAARGHSAHRCPPWPRAASPLAEAVSSRSHPRGDRQLGARARHGVAVDFDHLI
jgi:CheY-like chemotaxis protein